MIRFLASGFGTGHLPYMPGTWGSLVAIPFAWLLAPFGWQGMLIATVISFLLGWGLSNKLLLDSPEDTDPSYIVIDEIAGLLFTYCLVQLVKSELSSGAIALGFLMFRLFDIWKPFPIGWVEIRLASSPRTSGLGIMVDDIIAAIPAAALTILVLFF